MLLCSAAPVFAQPQSYVALDNGYRWDHIGNRVTLGGPTISVKGSSQELKKINSYQLGARGQWTFYENTFVRANGHYGWTWDGKYRESGIHGHAKGNTWDVEGALGYYFCAYRKTNLDEVTTTPPKQTKTTTQQDIKEKTTAGFWVAPVFGWSYDSFNLRGTDLDMSLFGIDYTDLDHINARQTFNGPYGGFDLLWQLVEHLNFLFSYEFHYTYWNGKREIDGPDYGNPPFGWSTGFSNKRRISGVIGQVFKIDTSYDFHNSWKLGLELTYQYFAGDGGHYKQTKTPLLPQFNFAKVDGLWWQSFGITLYMGGKF